MQSRSRVIRSGNAPREMSLARSVIRSTVRRAVSGRRPLSQPWTVARSRPNTSASTACVRPVDWRTNLSANPLTTPSADREPGPRCGLPLDAATSSPPLTVTPASVTRTRSQSNRVTTGHSVIPVSNR